MEPVAAFIESAIHQEHPAAKLEVIPWTVTGKSLSELEQTAKDLVRATKPDLVVLTIPTSAEPENFEAQVHAISWLMNWSLSFGHQEWDCVVVHPSVIDPDTDLSQGALIRSLVRAQHLDLIDRKSGETTDFATIVQAWFKSQMTR